MSDRSFEDEINIEITKRDADAFMENMGLSDIPIYIMVPNCDCDSGLDDSTDILKCPICGVPGVKE